MKYISILIAMAAVALAGSSCSEGGVGGGEPIKASPNKFSITKAASEFLDSDFANGNHVGLYIVARASVDVPRALEGSGNLFDNKEFVYNSGAMTATTEASYPLQVPYVDIYGYAPYRAGGIDIQKRLLFSVAADQSTSLSASDLLWVNSGTVSTTSTTTPKLIFSHRLCKIIVKLTAATGVTLTTPTVTINNTLPTVEMNMEDGTLTPAQGSATTIKACNIPTTMEFHAIVVPQNIATLANFITITTPVKSYQYDLPAAKQLVSGKVYTFDLTVNTSDLTVKVDGSVGDWAVGDTTAGEAI